MSSAGNSRTLGEHDDQTERPNMMNALIVDDQPSTLMLMQAILNRAGYTVEECTRGEGAIDALSTKEFDLVILDINLPDISGVDLLRDSRLAQHHLPPVLGITAALTPELHAQAIAAGMCRVLEKPVSYEQLAEAAAVAVHVGKAMQHAEDATPVIDLVTLSTVRDLHDDDLAWKFVNQAILDARICFEELMSAGRSKDLLMWRTHAKTLDGLALTLGARRLSSFILGALNTSSEHLGRVVMSVTNQISELLEEAETELNQWLLRLRSRGIRARLSADKRKVPYRLTERELTVLRWTAAGRTSNAIATILGISTRTVNFHITTALFKLDALNKTQAVVKAVMLGLLSLDSAPSEVKPDA